MIKTAVLQKDGAWWFKWCNIADPDAVMLKDGKPWGVAGSALAQDLEGPFRSKHEAEIAREKFTQARKQKYPFERFQSY